MAKLLTTDSAPDTAADSATSRLLADADACYRAMQSHDARFDGRFFVAVRTTRIYCRPVCRVRLPRQRNCTFYPSAAAAEGAGYRPCLRCRPELAPGWAAIDSASQLARAAAHLIETTLAEGADLTAVAARVGVTDRHLRRLFDTHFGVSPVAYAQTQRLLLAKRLLTDTRLSVLAVANAAGFGSVRRLNASMRERYRLTPTDLRKKSLAGSEKAGVANESLRQSFEFVLPLRQPYDWPAMHGFLASRVIGGLEVANAREYKRIITLTSPESVHTGWLAARVTGKKPVMVLSVSHELGPVLAQVLPLARTLFDLDLEPESVNKALGALALERPGLRLAGAANGFEIAVRAVLGQQITVKAARTLAERLVRTFGESCDFPTQPALTHAFPTASQIAEASAEQMGKLGVIRRRVQTIKTIAKELTQGNLLLSPGAPVDETLAALKALPGVGDWTAQYIAMRALRWPDAFPAADYGVMKALNVKTAAQATRAAQNWRPWRAYAVMHLWASLAEEKKP
ncbi:MAG: DNA-3-methyladenine glycosylase 2 family protein [Burkholderiaceae bacterium]